MNTLLARLNAVFAYTLTVMAVLTFLCFASTFFNDNMATVEIKAGNTLVKTMPDFTADRERKDLASVSSLGLKVDLSKVFNWNVKEIFLYLTAHYATESYAVNQVVLWDKIILREQSQVVDLPSVDPEYYFFDEGKGLLGNDNVTLTLSWHVIPNAGNLPMIRGSGSTVLKLPKNYTPTNSRF